MPRSILILHKKKRKKKGGKSRDRWNRTKNRNDKTDKKGGRKMVQVAHRQITLLPIPSSASLPFFPRREAINLQFFQSFVPPFSSFSKTTAMVRSFDSRQGSKSLASPGNGHLETRPKEWTHREPSRVGQTFRAILVNNSLFLQGWKKRISFLEIFTSLRPPRGR